VRQFKISGTSETRQVQVRQVQVVLSTSVTGDTCKTSETIQTSKTSKTCETSKTSETIQTSKTSEIIDQKNLSLLCFLIFFWL
jgi:hypothetical protein